MKLEKQMDTKTRRNYQGIKKKHPKHPKCTRYYEVIRQNMLRESYLYKPLSPKTEGIN